MSIDEAPMGADQREKAGLTYPTCGCVMTSTCCHRMAAALAAQHEAEQREAAIVEELADLQVAYQREIRRRIQVEEAVDAVIADIRYGVPGHWIQASLAEWRRILTDARAAVATASVSPPRPEEG